MMKRLTKFLNLLKNLSNDFFDKENDIFNKYFFIQYKLLIQYI